jgi:elongator complex protein 4
VATNNDAASAPFCHVFDLAKRLAIPPTANIHYVPISTSPQESPFSSALKHFSRQLLESPPTTIHRVVIPTLLSPALYPPQASEPSHIIQFFHALRSLLRQYPSQLTIMTSIPLELYPRNTGLVRWLELLNDGVIELTPFPHAFDEGPAALSTSGAATSQEDQPQGLVKVHKLPVFHERGGGGGGLKSMGDDLAFTVSRRKFTIKPFSLPPAEGDTEAQKGGAQEAQGPQKLTKESIEF